MPCLAIEKVVFYDRQLFMREWQLAEVTPQQMDNARMVQIFDLGSFIKMISGRFLLSRQPWYILCVVGFRISADHHSIRIRFVSIIQEMEFLQRQI